MKKFSFPILLLIVLAVAFTITLRWAINIDIDGDAFGAWIVVVVVAICLLVLLIAWPCQYGCSIGAIAKLRAFFEETKESYDYVITATKQMEIEVRGASQRRGQNEMNLQDLVYFQLGSAVSKRMAELRNKVKWYNEELEKYHRWNCFWFSRGFIPNVPENLKFITLET